MPELQYYNSTCPNFGEPPNKGKLWTYGDLDELSKAYHNGLSFAEICKELGRPPAGVLHKLCDLGILGVEPGTYRKYVRKPPKNVNKQAEIQTEKEIIMSTENIETKVFIQGKDASEMTDAQIFSLIAKLEAEQDKLSQIKNKPKKLVLAVEKLGQDIQRLVEYVDAR